MKTLSIAAVLLVLAAPLVAQNVPGQHFIESWDSNADGQVTLEEATERRSDVFASFDQDDDGYLDAEDYKLFDEARANDQADNKTGHGAGNQNAANGMTLAVNDVDGDGKVSLSEFLGRTADWIAKLDKNGDGVVTTEDFGRGNG